MTDLETMELALRRALSAELKERIQDLSAVHVLERVICELIHIQLARKPIEPSLVVDSDK